MYAIIAGGGKVGFYLARELIGQSHEVLVIENRADRAEVIANELGNVILRGNADEATTLRDAGAERADVVVAVTGDDEDNLVICQVARRRFNVPRTIARVNNPQNEELFHRLGIDITVSSTKLILSLIEQELPSRPFIPLVTLRSIGMEIVELNALAGSPLIGRRVGDLQLPPDSTVSLIMRGSQTIIPTPDTTIQVDDKLIGFSPLARENELVEAVKQS